MKEILFKDIVKIHETSKVDEVNDLLSRNGVLLDTYKKRWWEDGEVFEKLVYSLGKVDANRDFAE